jgi:hypothetical protein
VSSRAVIRFAFFGTKIAAVAVTVVLGFTWVTTSTNDATAWLKDRRTRFAAYRTAHPNPDAEIADINAKTAALIAAYAPPRAGDLAGVQYTR